MMHTNMIRIASALCLTLASSPGAAIFAAPERISANTPVKITQKHSKPVCGPPEKNKARCLSHVVTTSTGIPQATNSPPIGSYGPTQFHIGYNLPCTPNGYTQSTCSTPSTFGPQTVAIVDAYHAATLENDLNVYSIYNHLPPCTRANGCLTIVNQNGGTPLPATTDSGWALETSLDVEVAHAICQTCKILLVEANTTSLSDLGASVNTAAAMGATAISNSYGTSSEWPGETSFDTYYYHPGIAVTVSAGDSGFSVEYPASSPNVVAVGGTTLDLYSDNTYAGETVWNGTGSGCSAYESANSWQTSALGWGQTGCGNMRGVGDVAADADPSSGASIYDSTSLNGSIGWYQVGGTSLASPLIAAVYALAGGIPSNRNAAALPYTNFTSANSHDIISGSNGTCGTAMCVGGSGYDGPTGLGTPNGLQGFMTNTATRIDAGSTATFTDLAGNTWLADTGFTGGGIVDRGSISIANTADPRMYQTEHYGMSSFSYPVGNGTYTVKLHFAETFSGVTGPGQRLFNVTVNGTPALTNFDVYADAGGKYVADVKTVTTTVSNGQMSILFAKTTSSPNLPEINGIQVLLATTPSPTSTSTPTQSPSSTSTPTQSPSPTSTPTPSPSPTPTSTLRPSATPTQTAVVRSVRIDSGSTSSYTDSKGNGWLGDTGFTGGGTVNRGAITIANTNNAATGTTDQSIYQTEHYRMSAFSYPVANGTYKVRLHFAETYSGVDGPGQRVFNVTLNGSQVLTGFDVYVQAGGRNSAVAKTFTTNVSNGQMGLTFSQNGGTQPPEINGIEMGPATAQTAGVTARLKPASR